MRHFANVTSNVPPILPATISDFNIDDYLNNFFVDCCFIEEYDDNILRKRKITYNHNAAVRNIEANLEKYGLKLEVDSANLPVLLSATIRPPFETFRPFRSPNNRGKEVNFCVFCASHCHQLRSHGWVEIIVEFISPQQDILSPEILRGDTEISSSIMTEAGTSIITQASASISSEASASITDTVIPEIAMKLPSSTEYWRNWKKELYPSGTLLSGTRTDSRSGSRKRE